MTLWQWLCMPLQQYHSSSAYSNMSHRSGLQTMPRREGSCWTCVTGGTSLLNVVMQDYGYSANASKTWLVVKAEYLDQAKEIFAESGVQITAEGRRHLGAALGTRSFAEAFVSTKVQEWVEEIDTLTLITQSQPHAAFAGLTHGLISKWNYMQRAIPDTGELFQPLEDAIRLNLLPILTGKPGITDQERALLELPACLGGLGITNATKTAYVNHHNLVQLTRQLVQLIQQQMWVVQVKFKLYVT